jgi:hypothetical protein
MDTERWQSLERLYHLALERNPEERGKFIAEACHDDEELRRELESLLKQDVAPNSPLIDPHGRIPQLAGGCTYSARGAGGCSWARIESRLQSVRAAWAWIRRTCAIVNRNLSLAEWQQYLGTNVSYRKTCSLLSAGTGAPAR